MPSLHGGRLAVGKKNKLPGTYSGPQFFQEGVAPDGFDEAGHIIVLTDHGLAAIIAGLRVIRHQSPEVEPLLETLEEQLRNSIKASDEEVDKYG